MCQCELPAERNFIASQCARTKITKCSIASADFETKIIATVTHAHNQSIRILHACSLHQLTNFA